MASSRITYCVLIALLALSAGPAVADDPPIDQASAARGVAILRDMQNAFADVARRTAPSVVAVQAKRKLSSVGGIEDHEEYVKQFGDRLVPSVGSGVIIDAAGLVLTNEHVIYAAEELTVVLSDRRRFEARLIGSDARSDLAVLQIVTGEAKVKFAAATLADLSTVRQGHWAIAMGNAFGLAAEGRPAMTIGVVSAIGRVLPSIGAGGDRYYGNLIQTSADINPGNSGGPLLDIEGRVIGINTAISSRSGVSEGVGFAIPVTERTQSIVAALSKGEKIEYGFLGVVVRSPGPEEATRGGSPPYVGAVIDMVERNTPADDAKLRVGDIILRIDDVSIEDSDHLVRTIGSLPVGRKVQIVVQRDRKQVTVSATLKKRGDMIARWRPDPVWLDWRGMRLGSLSEQRRRELDIKEEIAGLEVISVEAGSEAAQAGVRAGDVLTELSRKSIKSLEDFRGVVESLKPSDDVYARLAKGGLKLLQGKKE